LIIRSDVLTRLTSVRDGRTYFFIYQDKLA